MSLPIHLGQSSRSNPYDGKSGCLSNLPASPEVLLTSQAELQRVQYFNLKPSSFFIFIFLLIYYVSCVKLTTFLALGFARNEKETRAYFQPNLTLINL